MSKHYNYEYKKKPRVKKELVFGDLHIPMNVGYETSFEMLDKIEQAQTLGEAKFCLVVKDIIKEIFGEYYDKFIEEFEKDGDKFELEDFQDISQIVIASLQNVEPEKVENFFRNNN